MFIVHNDYIHCRGLVHVHNTFQFFFPLLSIPFDFSSITFTYPIRPYKLIILYTGWKPDWPCPVLTDWYISLQRWYIVIINGFCVIKSEILLTSFCNLAHFCNFVLYLFYMCNSWTITLLFVRISWSVMHTVSRGAEYFACIISLYQPYLWTRTPI